MTYYPSSRGRVRHRLATAASRLADTALNVVCRIPPFCGTLQTKSSLSTTGVQRSRDDDGEHRLAATASRHDRG